MIWVTKWIRLTRSDNPSRAHPPLLPNRHGLIKTDDPRFMEEVSNVVVECLKKVMEPEFVKVLWREEIGES